MRVMELSRSLFLLGLSLFLYCQVELSLASPSRTNPYAPNTNHQHSTRTSSSKQDYIRNTSDQNGSNGLPNSTMSSTIGRNESGILVSPNRNESDVRSSCSDENMSSGKCNRPMGLDMKQLSLDLIRHDILRKLRFDENRLPIKSELSKDYLLKLAGLVGMQNDSPHVHYDDDHAITEQIISFSKPQLKLHGRTAHSFSFTDKLSNMGIETAVLSICVKFHEGANPVQHNGDFYIQVLQLIPSKRNESPLYLEQGSFKGVLDPPEPDQHNIRHDNTKWIHMDIRTVFSKWLAHAHETSPRKIILYFNVTDAHNSNIAVISLASNPFLKIEVSDRGRSRSARDLGLECLESSKETRCCRYPLTVDFDEFGWDWVIAPKQYEANYCSGECPYAFLQKYPHNHIVQQANRGIGGPCCTARKLSPITMLHFDHEQNIVFSVLPGMVVDQCGCS